MVRKVSLRRTWPPYEEDHHHRDNFQRGSTTKEEVTFSRWARTFPGFNPLWSDHVHVKSIVKAASNGSSPTHNGPEKSKEGGKKEVEKVAKKLNWAAQKWIASTAQLISLFFIRPGILRQKRSRRMLGIHFAFRNIIPNWPRNPKKHNNNLCLRSPYFWATYSERHQGAPPIWRGLWSFPRIKFVF